MPIGMHLRRTLVLKLSWPIITAVISLTAVSAMAIDQEGTPGMSPAVIDNLSQNANIIFIGTVTGPAPSAEKDAVEVKIESALKTPEQLGPLDGLFVSLIPQHPDELRVDDRYVFFTRTQRLGARLLLREIGRFQTKDRDALSRALEQSEVNTKRSQLSARLKSSDVVVVGKVRNIEPVKVNPANPVSEHDPQWMRATIAIEAVLAGSIKEQQLMLVFPGSRDVAWIGMPRPTEGQQAVWLLTADPDLGGYKALDPLDVQSLQKTSEIRGLLKQIQ